MFRLFVGGALCISLASAAFGQGWAGYGGNPQHTAQFHGTSQAVSRIHWQAPVDDDPGYYGGVVFAHYASPMISPANTVVYPYRTTTTVNGQKDYDHWNIIGVSGASGANVFSFYTDYSAAVVYPADWTSILPTTLVQLPAVQTVHIGGGPLGPPTALAATKPEGQKRIAFAPTTTAGVVAGAGGSIFVRTSVDMASSPTKRYIFYTSLQDFNANFAAYTAVKIVTPLTSDANGNIYFGYEVNGSMPASFNLGSGGVVKISAATGVAIYKSVQTSNIDSSISRPAFNAAPALSNDGSQVYFTMVGNGGFLAEFSTSYLSLTHSVHMADPTTPGAWAVILNESSAAPMVGPDGHVFMGVFRNNWGESHGILLQYDQNLNPKNAAGQTWAPGAFGWDDTPSIVPSSIVPSYKGTSSYLLLCKYNNYDDNGGDPGADGSNHVAVIDPSSDSITRDRQSGIPVMNEVLLLLSPNKTGYDGNHPNSRFEWCINSAAIDIAKKGAIVNCEDGHVYRWSFVTNTITEALNLQPPTSEAYTSTVIGPDGQIYALNNAILFAIGF
jgi:hypothetical protein